MRRGDKETTSRKSTVADFKQLRVYRLAFDSANQLYRATKSWPAEERYSLTDQVRRASRAVCANVAEAWLKRRYPKHFVSKLSDAASEAAEVLVWLDFAVAAGCLPERDASELEQAYRQVIGGLVRMQSRPDQWCVSTGSVREDDFYYDPALPSLFDS